MKVYSTLLKDPGEEPRHQMFSYHINDTREECPPFLHMRSWCVLHELISTYKGNPFSVIDKVLGYGLNVPSSNFSHVATFTFGLIPKGRVWTPLSSPLAQAKIITLLFYFKALELNIPQKFICHLTKKLN